MSHDLDSALRDSLRRHAESAPTVVDTDGIRLRAKKIQRRRTLESVAAAFVLLGVVVGLGAVIGSLRTDATPPPVTTVTPAPNPGNLPPLAFTNGDGNNPDRLIVRVAGVETVVPNPAAGTGPLSFVGWYGPDHRTLVMASGATGLREGTLYAVSLGADGRVAGSPQPLTVPGLPSLGAGIVFPARGGPIQFWVPLAPGNPRSPSTLVTIAPDLASGTSRSMPTGFTVVAATADHALLVSPGTSALSVASLAGTGTPSPEPVTACERLTAVQTNLEGTKAALGCGDGTVDLLTLADRSITRLAAVPELTPEVGPLGVWWDPSGGVHVSTTPTGRADYTEVHSWDWNGTSWARGLDGLLTRTYPLGAPSARFMKENAAPGNNGRWIVESTPEVDLGPAGDTVAIAPSAEASPTPTPSSTTDAPAFGWITTTRAYEKTGRAPLTDIVVTVGTRRVVVTTVENALARPLGWYGIDHLTLVWEEGNGDPGLHAVTFRADGTPADTPHPLVLPGITASTSSEGVIFGQTVAVPGDGFVVWSEGTGSGGTSEYLRVDDALEVVSRTPADKESGVISAGRDSFVTLPGNTLTTPSVGVHTSSGVTQVALPTSCDGLEGGPQSPDGAMAPLWCNAAGNGGTGSAHVLDVANLRFTDSVLKAPGFAHFWWDGSGLHASTSTPGGWTTWLLDGSRWSTAPDGTPVQQVSSGGATFVQKADGRWYVEVDPEVALDSYDPPVARPMS